MIKALLSILSALLSVYTLLCFVYIIMTWIPGLRYTKFGRVICSICEPYLGLFSRLGLRIGNVDFSPIISIGLLTLASSILGGIQATGRIWFGGILYNIIGMIWNLFATLLTLFTLLVLVRWIVLLVNHGQTSYNSGWNSVDRMINSITYKISNTFVRKPHNYQTSLLVSWIALLVIRIAGQFLIMLLLNLCYNIPF